MYFLLLSKYEARVFSSSDFLFALLPGIRISFSLPDRVTSIETILGFFCIFLNLIQIEHFDWGFRLVQLFCGVVDNTYKQLDSFVLDRRKTNRLNA